jgi:hypothetical protein
MMSARKTGDKGVMAEPAPQSLPAQIPAQTPAPAAPAPAAGAAAPADGGTKAGEVPK